VLTEADTTPLLAEIVVLQPPTAPVCEQLPTTVPAELVQVSLYCAVGSAFPPDHETSLQLWLPPDITSQLSDPLSSLASHANNNSAEAPTSKIFFIRPLLSCDQRCQVRHFDARRVALLDSGSDHLPFVLGPRRLPLDRCERRKKSHTNRQASRARRLEWAQA
jgi:hypothetical protein